MFLAAETSSCFVAVAATFKLQKECFYTDIFATESELCAYRWLALSLSLSLSLCCLGCLCLEPWKSDVKRHGRSLCCFFFYKKGRLLSSFWKYTDDAGIAGVYFNRDYDLGFQCL